MMPKGVNMKSLRAVADMLTTMKRKNPISRYFRLRKGISSHRGMVRFRWKSLRPSFHRYSEIVPTGHSHEQNAFLTIRLESKKTEASTIAEGWISGAR